MTTDHAQRIIVHYYTCIAIDSHPCMLRLTPQCDYYILSLLTNKVDTQFSASYSIPVKWSGVLKNTSLLGQTQELDCTTIIIHNAFHTKVQHCVSILWRNTIAKLLIKVEVNIHSMTYSNLWKLHHCFVHKMTEHSCSMNTAISPDIH